MRELVEHDHGGGQSPSDGTVGWHDLDEVPVRLQVTRRVVTSNSLRRPVRVTRPRIRRTRIAAWSASAAAAAHSEPFGSSSSRTMRNAATSVVLEYPRADRASAASVRHPKDGQRIGPLDLGGGLTPPFSGVEHQRAQQLHRRIQPVVVSSRLPSPQALRSAFERGPSLGQQGVEGSSRPATTVGVQATTSATRASRRAWAIGVKPRSLRRLAAMRRTGPACARPGAPAWSRRAGRRRRGRPESPR